jgi:predicted tellurium resistance membrane protein TerC
MMDALATLALLIGLELVLGVDNILVISILVDRLPGTHQNRARFMGLAVALIARIFMLFILITLTNLTNVLFLNLSIRDLILLAGGLFLLWKAVKEIHHTIELKDQKPDGSRNLPKSIFTVILQIVILDIVFSIDSVITAIGLTDKLWVIVTAVIVSFIAILAFARPVGAFIMKHAALKILALSFLITIGVTIFMEGLHKEVPKAYIYLPMGFALLVEVLQLRYERNLEKKLRLSQA